jgi:hypothetical protein
MKKLILATVVSLLFACAEMDVDENGRKVSSEMRFTPTGAKFIRDYGGMWTKWSLGGECFLTYNIKGSSGLMAKVDCGSEQ